MMNKRTEWFEEARFGMFIHWGLYTIPAKGEWYVSSKEKTVEEYERYMEEFDPISYNPADWVRAAKRAGMKYMVLTAKHHDGFCLFDSKLTEYKAANTKAGRDLVREYVEAVRAEGLKVGLYYSLLDWHHPDYPKYHDKYHPLRGMDEVKDDNPDWNRYLEYMHGQVRELCTNYGKLDLLWFDFSYGEMCGEMWKATELVKMVRSLQPDIMIDDRLEAGERTHGTILDEVPSSISGDFACPELYIPVQGIRNKLGEKVPWELCATLNDSWGYTFHDRNYKSAGFLIRKLVECVSKSGNMILNVGPDCKGKIPKEQLLILEEIGNWMETNGESIYGCEEAGLSTPDWGRYTKKGNVLYAHIMEAPIGPVLIAGVEKNEISSIRMLAGSNEVTDATDSLAGRKHPDLQFVSLGRYTNPTYLLPDVIDTVLKIELKE